MIKWEWDQVESAVKVLADNLKGQKKLLILGIKNGGVIPAMLVVKSLNNPSIEFQAFDPKIDSPTYVYRRFKDYDKIIFIDDINDSGRTINSIGELFQKAFINVPHLEQPKILFMTLIARKTSQAPSYSAIIVDHQDWIVFPWESREEPEVRNRDILEKGVS